MNAADKVKVAVLDDYQGVALRYADWTVLDGRAEITVFRDHLHEREVVHQLGHAVEFLPHVAAYFRGITLTANLHLTAPTTHAAVLELYRAYYVDAPLIAVRDDAPWVSAIANRHGAILGGFALDAAGTRLVVVCVLDNLLKGAATQALQNLNLAFGRPSLEGIAP